MIVYKNDDDSIGVIIPAPAMTDEDIVKDVPEGAWYAIVNSLPEDRMFRAAWRITEIDELPVIVENLAIAIEVAHTLRRDKRSAEFAPFDIMATIPSQAVYAEEQRELIRQKYADFQVQIDACVDIPSLRAVMLLIGA